MCGYKDKNKEKILFETIEITIEKRFSIRLELIVATIRQVNFRLLKDFVVNVEIILTKENEDKSNKKLNNETKLWNCRYSSMMNKCNPMLEIHQSNEVLLID